MGGILGKETAGEELARFNIKLLFPTGSDSTGQPTFTSRKFAGVTRGSLKGATALMGIGGLVLLPAGVAPAEVALNEVEFRTLDDVELVDGGTYLVMQPVAPNKEQVDTLQCWQDSCVEADQVVGAKHALAKLRAAGHPEAKVLSVKKLRTNAAMVEVDGVVIAKGCAIIIENKTELTAEAAALLVDKMAVIRVMVASMEAPSSTPLGQLKGKQLLPVLCGRAVTSNTTDLTKMADICRQHKIECWDVSRSGMELSSDGCFKSPYVHPFGKDRGKTTAAVASQKVATRAGAAESSALRSLSHSAGLLRFTPRGRAMLGQPPRLRLF
ncbi:hypothetical protein GPECTOR_15g300 [Gonium pectorale]|uniref:Uncharacterized protein n=1 Tax=Gonium pectorale TaxID=33097 RepID=A0A150GLF4_GONPE|nr:hypothetical protein GPECTOR_15g300 [Gonium pectorale]|eukprot:KXZ50617.1 hypothetical protein GPECTOR_15g300 [Gonium pectorale]